jgi:purine nucleosidase
MAMQSPLVRVAAITVVAGNVSLEQGTQNALLTVEMCDADVPVYPGAAAPLVRPLQKADWFHGNDGLGDHGYAPATRKAEATHAVDAIIATVKNNPGIEVITLGPLTNLALALQREPSIVANIGRCVVMGGAPCCEGNVTPSAEFNIWVDPEAARIVFLSGIGIEMIGWHLSRHQAVIDEREALQILAFDTRRAEFAIRCNSSGAAAYKIQTGQSGICLPDPIAMAVLLYPELNLSSSVHFVEIETVSDLTRGLTLVDRLNVHADPRNQSVWAKASAAATRTNICWQLDIPGWKAALMASLR